VGPGIKWSAFDYGDAACHGEIIKIARRGITWLSIQLVRRSLCAGKIPAKRTGGFAMFQSLRVAQLALRYHQLLFLVSNGREARARLLDRCYLLCAASQDEGNEDRPDDSNQIPRRLRTTR
jgi:hypothetical protein